MGTDGSTGGSIVSTGRDNAPIGGLGLSLGLHEKALWFSGPGDVVPLAGCLNQTQCQWKREQR